MKAQEAADLLNRTTFRPGWKIRARVTGSWTIEIRYVLETVDTSYPGPDGRYIVPRTLDQEVPVDVFSLDEHSLLRLVLTGIQILQEHEDREFLRIRRNGEWVAPFHPHNEAGQRAWAVTEAERKMAGLS